MFTNIGKTMDEGFTFSIPSGVELGKLGLNENISVIIGPGSNLSAIRDNAEYEQFLADMWAGTILTLMVLVCVCCMCSCLLYHKFQQWKRSVIPPRTPSTMELGSTGSFDSELPTYSIASGLPSYEEAIERLRKTEDPTEAQEKSLTSDSYSTWVPRTPPTPVHLSVTSLFHYYDRPNTNSGSEVEAKPT